MYYTTSTRCFLRSLCCSGSFAIVWLSDWNGYEDVAAYRSAIGLTVSMLRSPCSWFILMYQGAAVIFFSTCSKMSNSNIQGHSFDSVLANTTVVAFERDETLVDATDEYHPPLQITFVAQALLNKKKYNMVLTSGSLLFVTQRPISDACTNRYGLRDELTCMT